MLCQDKQLSNLSHTENACFLPLNGSSLDILEANEMHQSNGINDILKLQNETSMNDTDDSSDEADQQRCKLSEMMTSATNQFIASGASSGSVSRNNQKDTSSDSSISTNTESKTESKRKIKADSSETEMQASTKKRKNIKKATSSKPKKPSKPQYQRRNIKKIRTEDKLNESTLRALQEEKERQNRRLQNAALNSTTEDANDSITNFQNDATSDEIVTTSKPTKVEPDIPFLVLEDNVNDNNEHSHKQQAANTPQHQFQLQNDSSTVSKNSLNNSAQFIKQPVEEIVLDSDDDDDCQILSDTEDHKTQPLARKPTRIIHTKDEMNVLDANGQVLINVNHPPQDKDIFLLPFLARNVKAHQIGGIRFIYDNIVESLQRLRDTSKGGGFGCILAHAMGLGKTFQVIAFVEIFLRCTCMQRVLCIVPINTIQNWFSEFNSWLPENGQQKIDSDTIINYQRPFKVYLINDFAKTMKQRADIILEWRKNGGVLLIGYEMFRTLVTVSKNGTATQAPKKASAAAKSSSAAAASELVIDLEEEELMQSKQTQIEEALLTPCLVVCDEGHRIKNNAANIAKTLQRIETKRRVVLTGYPLQNNLIEYWCMVDFVRPSYLGTKGEFCNMFERPIINGQCMDSTREDVKLMRHRTFVLHSLLEGFVQRRGHDVFFCSLPRKLEYIVLLKLSPVQKQLYLAFMEAIGAMSQGDKTNPLRSFAICCKIWNHPDVLYNYHVNKEADMDLDLPDGPPLSASGAKAKQARAQSALKSEPTAFVGASSASSSSSLSYLIQEEGGFNPFASASQFGGKGSAGAYDPGWANKLIEKYTPDILENGAKIALSFSLIEESILAGDRILLFSQSLLSLNLIEKFLQRLNVPQTNEKWKRYTSYYRLDGSTSGVEREKLINAFNKPASKVWLFLISTRAGCLGINLIGANRVIVLDASWNPCHDAQAVCRVYRYGQTKNCYIYRLIADHTMEKKIYDRQISKQSMSDRVIDEIQAENHFTRTEVEKLIHFVKEDVPAADLSDMASKYDDGVLVRSCTKHSHAITKEPFTHESLLIDKKEYKLSDREKLLAFREYEHEKTFFPNARSSSSSFSAAFLQRHASSSQLTDQPSVALNPLLRSTYSSNSFRPMPEQQLCQFQPKASNYATNLNYNNNNTTSYFNGNMNQNMPLSYAAPIDCASNSAPYATNNSKTNGFFNSAPQPNPFNQNASTSFYVQPSVSQSELNSANQSNGSSSQQQQQQSKEANSASFEGQIPNLCDVKISCFITQNQIIIPETVSSYASNGSGSPTVPTPSGNAHTSGQIIIQPGEKVFILKTPKTTYLRTQDKKYIPLNTSSVQKALFEDSKSMSNTNGDKANAGTHVTAAAVSQDMNNAANFIETPTSFCENNQFTQQIFSNNSSFHNINQQLGFNNDLTSDYSEQPVDNLYLNTN